jgi:hypothetical protein
MMRAPTISNPFIRTHNQPIKIEPKCESIFPNILHQNHLSSDNKQSKETSNPSIFEIPQNNIDSIKQQMMFMPFNFDAHSLDKMAIGGKNHNCNKNMGNAVAK